MVLHVTMCELVGGTKETLVHVFVVFPNGFDKTCGKRNSRKEKITLAHSPRLQPACVGKSGCSGGPAEHIHSQEAEEGECRCSVTLFPHLFSGTP